MGIDLAELRDSLTAALRQGFPPPLLMTLELGREQSPRN
jgi:hypothetical protein